MITQYENIPACLRLIADAIESGNLADARETLVIVRQSEHTDFFLLGPESTTKGAIELLGEAQRQLFLATVSGGEA